MKEKELLRLIQISKLYYEENKTQAEIARIMNISRPSVSNLLTKARKAGVVKIDIMSYDHSQMGLSQSLCQRFNLKTCHVMESGEDFHQTAARVLMEYLANARVLGLGWGYNINRVIEALPQAKTGETAQGIVCPLIGTATVPHRGYHPNELATDLSRKTGFQAEYLISPAFPTTEQDQELFMNTTNYHTILERWRKTDTAIITLGSFPLVPDHGTALRFGKKLTQEKAVGSLLSYFFNLQGERIEGDDDYAIQIPLRLLARIKHVIGIVPPESNTSAVISCLRTGYIKHLVIAEQTAKDVIDQNQSN
ncbi:Sorbitol operon regulator [anaerobic digester metagenome]|jgi:DNA-binding transcriptional regulator LsrR (DeoR family)|uniref:sugar-binding transcriptional regulator n=1 Tax=Acetobacterium sp. UBA5834 TaxID=1945907 RepID=UPI00257BD361|nr:sugar-binding domain-containing protein [Acetobacterium sp. UBA5834]